MSQLPVRTLVAAAVLALSLHPAVGHAGPEKSKGGGGLGNPGGGNSGPALTCSAWALVDDHRSCEGVHKVSDGPLGAKIDYGDDDEYGLIGQSGGANDPFEPIAGALTQGRLNLKSAWVGTFILALKSGDEYGLYEFHSDAGVSSIDFELRGVGGNGKAAKLSYAALYGGSARPVPSQVIEPNPAAAIPEPGTPALLLAGLAAAGLLARRRRA